jgi:Protein of unknown function (DUF3375)
VHYDEIEQLRTRHSAWLLLSSRNSALVLSFLGRVFIDANASNLPATRLVDELDDELYVLNQRLADDDGELRHPRPARQYLDEWAAPERGWLRRFYPPDSDEPHYDLTPAVEKALAWVDDLRARTFVGTESRLTTIFELLRQLVYGADADPAARLADLRRRRAAIDAEIDQLEAGEVALADPVTQRDRYQQFARTARELLADFRQVEENFRDLDRDLREQIARWDGSKGELLEDLFSNRRGITESDQGRSFRAFYDLLLSSERQAELTDLLRHIHELDTIADLDPRLARVHYDWIDASERTQATVRRLSEQLRRFLDDKVWMENRRVFDLLRSIESQAVRLRAAGDRVGLDAAVTMDLDGTAVPVKLPMERPLYRRTRTRGLEVATLEAGVGDLDDSSLFDQLHVDRDALVRTVLEQLGPRPSIGLDEVVAAAPLEQGLAELVGYLSLEQPGLEVTFDDDARSRVSWIAEALPGVDGATGHGEPGSDPDGGQPDDELPGAGAVERVADIPVVTFRRVEAG